MHRVLLCAPDYYGIEYEINPWMHRKHAAQLDLAQAQWAQLLRTLQKSGCQVEQITPQPGLPDMVFTANAGLVAGRRFIAANFRYPERQGEEKHFSRWFADHGYEVIKLPPKFIFEGEGDALFCGKTLFCGYRFRSDIRSHIWLGEFLQCLVISAELVNDRFYHLDTCFCPLGPGQAVWFPDAFDPYGQKAIREHCPDLIDVDPEEAMRFACNAVVLGKTIILPEGSPHLARILAGRNFSCHLLPMTEFMKAGGACKCLVLKISNGAEG